MVGLTEAYRKWHIMNNSYKREYVVKHQKIRDKLIELSKTNDYSCFGVARLASELKMDLRTVRAHLEIMEIDAAGTFTDVEQKQFCTHNGVALFTDIIGSREKRV